VTNGRAGNPRPAPNHLPQSGLQPLTSKLPQELVRHKQNPTIGTASLRLTAGAIAGRPWRARPYPCPSTGQASPAAAGAGALPEGPTRRLTPSRPRAAGTHGHHPPGTAGPEPNCLQCSRVLTSGQKGARASLSRQTEHSMRCRLLGKRGNRTAPPGQSPWQKQSKIKKIYLLLA